jgi:hypothetical protein
MTILENYLDDDGPRLSLSYNSSCNNCSIDWKSNVCELVNGEYPGRIILDCDYAIGVMIAKLMEARRKLNILGRDALLRRMT